MNYWRNNTIWFDEIPEDLYLEINLKNDLKNKIEFGSNKLADMVYSDNVQYLSIWHHKKYSKENFIHIPENLLYLEINRSNIEDFKGIERFKKLKRLELHYCSKLQTDSGLSAVADSLEHLHINQSKKFIPKEEIISLKNLRVLCLNSCGNIENLNFLYEFPHLIDFRFVDTNVLDGDLSPLINHPTIRSAGFLNKRHYNIKYKEMNNLLKDKNEGEEFETIIKNESGKYETFRYKY